jgi:hypothetical protein
MNQKVAHLINYFNTTKDSLYLLRKNVNLLKSHGRDVIITGHSSIPQDLIEQCEGFIYDKENLILNFDKIDTQWWWSDIGGTKLFSPYIWYGKTKSHSYCYAAMKSLHNGFLLSTQLGYSIIHVLEYDVEITDFSEFEDNESTLKNTNFCSIIYKDFDYDMIGNFASFKIEQLIPKWNKDSIIDKILNNKCNCEVSSENIYKEWFGQENIKIKPEKLCYRGQVTSVDNSPDFLLLKDGDILKLYLCNPSTETIYNLAIYHNSGKIIIDSLCPRCFQFFDLGEIEIPTFAHLYWSDKLIKKWDIDTDEDYKNYVLKNFISDEFNPPKID